MAVVLLAAIVLCGGAVIASAASRQYFKSWSETAKISTTEIGKRSCASYSHPEPHTLTVQVKNRLFGTVMTSKKVFSYYPNTVKSAYVLDDTIFNPISSVKAYAYYS